MGSREFQSKSHTMAIKAHRSTNVEWLYSFKAIFPSLENGAWRMVYTCCIAPQNLTGSTRNKGYYKAVNEIITDLLPDVNRLSHEETETFGSKSAM